VKQNQPLFMRMIMLSGLGAYAANVFTTWANGRGMHPPLKVAIAAMIVTAFNALAPLIDLRQVFGWTAVSLAGWAILAPADAAHMVASVAVFMSTARAGLALAFHGTWRVSGAPE
jgi:hypothetical protein